MNKPSLATMLALAGLASGSTRDLMHTVNDHVTPDRLWRKGANNQRQRRKKARIFRSHNRRAQRGRCR